ncbi:MAG: endonuclease/exonuclease/phosphatase family protein [Planctomycetota bacterium]
MQRLISFATLGVMGWLGWLFLDGGSLDLSALSRGQQKSASPLPSISQSSGSWPGQPSQQPVLQRQQPYQTTSTGENYAGPRPGLDGPTIRIASFNIQVFGNTKAGKPYVMQELAYIVNQFDVVAIQEIRSQNEYLIPNFVQLVNQSGRQFDHVIGPRLGITTSKEQYVYLFDSQKIEIDPQSVYTVSDPDGLLHREPLVATFRTRVDPKQAFTFTLINMHTDPDLVAQEMDVMAEVYRVVRRSGRGEDDIILLGDFNANERQLGQLGQLPGIMPVIAGVWTNTRQNKQYDNIIIHQPSTTEYSGRSGVFDFMRYRNLSLQQAVQVSDHFPVWAEFSAYERDAAGRIASRPGAYGR